MKKKQKVWGWREGNRLSSLQGLGSGTNCHGSGGVRDSPDTSCDFRNEFL
jgi:hypothetical protein